ncbi:protein kinase [Echinococcus multilocularis]|uniref:Protein kinase n=1 Tax=Echinococcus multilocularis TaxID=6211 RepID=A0A087W2F2_ECHMU|nr:protein kinase [Echinococcus multilocularis]
MTVGIESHQKLNISSTDVEAQSARYVIGLDCLEHRTEGCNFADTLRLTFYLQMPDANKPDSGLWKIRFRCNLYDTADDIKLFEGHGLTEINEEVERAIKEAVAVMLRGLQADENSIPLNHDYVFYPQLSPELKNISGSTSRPATAPTKTKNEKVGRPTFVPAAVANPAAAFVSRGVDCERSTTPQTDECSFVTLEAPFCTHSLLAQINTHLRRARPFLVLPENTQHPVVDLSMLSSGSSSTKIGDNVTLSINIREGLVNVSNSAHISKNTSLTEAGVVASQPNGQQQNVNYYNLSSEPVPKNTAGHFIQVPATVTPQAGSRLSQTQNQQMSIEQQYSHSEIPTSVSVCDQLIRQCLATLSANPSLLLATAATLSANNSTAPQPTLAGLLNLQTPSVESPWGNLTCSPPISFPPSTASLSNTDALKQILLRTALESAHHQQQQQPLLTPCATTVPAKLTTPTATLSVPVQPGLVSSTTVNPQNIIYEQMIWPNMPTKLVVVVPPTFIPQGQPLAPQPSEGTAAAASSVAMTTAVPRYVVTPAESLLSIHAPRESIVPSSSVNLLPPPPSPPISAHDVTVVSLDSGVAQPNPMESPHSPIPPPPPQHSIPAPAVPLQTAASGPSACKKVPPKFTVSSVESDSTLCGGGILPPCSTSDGTSIPAAPNATDTAPNITPNITLRSSPPSENDLSSACPPPPSTPAISRQGSFVDSSLPPSSSTITTTTTLL